MSAFMGLMINEWVSINNRITARSFSAQGRLRISMPHLLSESKEYGFL